MARRSEDLSEKDQLDKHSPLTDRTQRPANAVSLQSAPRQHFYSEEINPCQDRHVGANEVRSASVLAALGSGRDAEAL